MFYRLFVIIFYLFCSAGSTFPSELEKVFVSENVGKGSPRWALPLWGYPARPDWGEGRGGKDKMQRNLEILQKRVRVLEMGTVAITGVYARGLLYQK